MPAYNAERYVEAAIKSILVQSHRDFEFIIINDGSTDGTLDIIKRYEKKDPRIRVLTQKNQGISKSLNRGIKEARYEWIAIMDADDIALPHRLERQVKATIENPNVIAWGGYAYHISEKGKVLGISRVGPTNEAQFNKMLQNGELILVIHPTAFIHKEMIQKVGGYDPKFDACEDLELFNRLAEIGPILAIPEPLGLYRIHSSSISMKRFFEQRAFTRFVAARQKDKAEGKRPANLHEFFLKNENAPLLKKMRYKKEDLSHFYYRKFGVMISGGNYPKAILYFLMSAILKPSYSLPRVFHQRFGKEARETIKTAKGKLQK